ncbi:acyltransferase [Hahella sp. CR1]|uniref:acyltransferase family protein n=1 Tax=Hahella sp. CR1 TaxID=2992807 RepID=UPI002442FDFF|nr:acyltransferase [Hahella sp. CR1]MDG9667314.1 acyltransferase [Hahella sp. CR1]
MSSRVASLDACRGIAVFSVFLYHIYELKVVPEGAAFFSGWPILGMFGVDLFYVLSGFFIVLAIIKPKEWSPIFFMRARIQRIYPAYLVSLFIIVLLSLFFRSGFSADEYLVANVFMHLTMTHNFLPGVGGSINGVYWTLGVEFPYYILMLGLAVFFRDKRFFLPLTIFLILLSLVWRHSIFVFGPQDAYWRFFSSSQLLGVLDAFGIGGLVAYVFHGEAGGESIKKYRWGILAVSLIILAFLLYMFERNSGEYWFVWSYSVLWRTFLYGAFGGVILGLVYMKGVKSYCLLGLDKLGEISFSFYLYHLVIMIFINNSLSDFHYLVRIFFITTCSLLVSWVSWRFVEKPFYTRKSDSYNGGVTICQSVA